MAATSYTSRSTTHSRIAFVQIHHDEKRATCAGFLIDAFELFDRRGVIVHGVVTDNAKSYVESRAFQDALDGRNPRAGSR